MKHLFTGLGLLLLCTSFSVTQAQVLVSGTQNTNAFSELNSRRSRLNSEIPELEKQINEIYFKDTFFIVNEMNANKSYIKTYEKDIQRRGAKDTTIPTIQGYISYYSDKNDQLSIELASAKEASKRREELKNQLTAKKEELSKTENSINQLMIPELSRQNFMFSSSIAFVVLMSILLATFFFVVWRDAEIRRSIFGSDSGIQFIALFSIIIAIIIFGLTGVLEGKELSALLGSVAGYILGKAKFSGSSSSNGTPPPTVNPPAGGTLPPAGATTAGTAGQS